MTLLQIDLEIVKIFKYALTYPSMENRQPSFQQLLTFYLPNHLLAYILVKIDSILPKNETKLEKAILAIYWYLWKF